jgi:hypothetical protein
MIIPSVLSEGAQTVKNKYLVTDRMEDSPGLLTDENDSKSSLTTQSHSQLLKMDKRNLTEAQSDANRIRERERKKNLSKAQREANRIRESERRKNLSPT